MRTLDPANPGVKTGSTAGTIQSVLEVRGDAPAFYDGRPVPHGEIRTLWYDSKSLGTLRRLTIYVPPGYEGGEGRLPVVYLFHGANADENAWYRLGRVNLILDNLLAAGSARPFIVVMPFGYGVPPGTPGERGRNTPQFSRDLLEDVIPLVQSRYRTQSDRDHRAIIGLSMGGGESLSIGLNHLELFSYVGGFSAGLAATTDFAKAYPALVADPAASNRQLHLLWIGCGRDDGLFPTAKNGSGTPSTRARAPIRGPTGGITSTRWRRSCFASSFRAGLGRFPIPRLQGYARGQDGGMSLGVLGRIVGIVMLGSLLAGRTSAQTAISVANASDLVNALTTVDANPTTSYVINFSASVTLGSSTSLPAIVTSSAVTINGQSNILDGGGVQHGFFVYAGTVTIQNLTIQNMLAQGRQPALAEAEEAGLGAGGAIFMASRAPTSH